jgi:cytoskeletal protein RodZ
MEISQALMAESERKNRTGKGKGEQELPKASGVGALLREERRNRSLDFPQVARMTRLREPFLRAIEKEAWDELPAPVFVRGFVRSYARALGLDEQRVLALYDQARPLEPSVPRPLLEPEKTGRGRRILLILLLGVLAGILLYLWQGHPAPEWPLPREKSTATEEKTQQDLRDASIDKKPAPVRSQAEKMPGGVKETFPVPIEPLVESEAAEMRAAEPAPLPENFHSSLPATEGDAVPEEMLVLEADVRQRTWVQVSIDGEEPTNFLFESGSHPRWVAKESFNLLIGNASGIVLYFDGNSLENLGKPGQVVRVQLPGDVETSDVSPNRND